MLVRRLERSQRDTGCHHRGMWIDRRSAGEKLAQAVAGRVEGDVIVLGLARGGMIVAAPVANALGAPLDVAVPRKLGAPGNPELAIGAVALGVRVLDDELIDRLGVPDRWVAGETARQQAEIARRTQSYRDDRPPPVLSGRTVVLVDDGVATGSTALAAVAWAKQEGAARVVFVAPVAPAATARRLAWACDDAVFLETPTRFMAVGEFYRRFEQVDDDQVRELLAANG
jgi:putative phosphoribosyl transferase